MISALCIDCDRLMGIQVRMSRDSYLYIIQVYFPCSIHSIVHYREHLETLHNLISMYSSIQTGRVVLLGDFNAHINGHTFVKQKDRKGTALCELINLFNLIDITTSKLCSGADSSYVSYDKISTSLIDHVIISDELSYFVKYCKILDYDCIKVSSHSPIVFNIEFMSYDYVTQCIDMSVKWPYSQYSSKRQCRSFTS